MSLREKIRSIRTKLMDHESGTIAETETAMRCFSFTDPADGEKLHAVLQAWLAANPGRRFFECPAWRAVAESATLPAGAVPCRPDEISTQE